MNESVSTSPRLLHIYSGNRFGGVERMLLTIAETEPQQHAFALCFPGHFSNALEALGQKIYWLGPARALYPWTIASARTRLRKAIQETNFSAAIFHSPWSWGLLGQGVRANRANFKAALWVHDIWSGRSWVERLAAISDPDRIIVNSNYSAQALGRFFPGVKTSRIYCPVALAGTSDREAMRAAVRARFGISNDVFVGIFAARFERWKGLGLHVEAFLALGKELPWESWIIGAPQTAAESQWLAELKRMIAHAGLSERFRFLGHRDDVKNLLRAADVHFQPNLGPEPFGIAFIEAMDAGLPILSRPEGAIPEITTDKTAHLVDSLDPLQFAQALRKLACSPSLRAQLGNAGPHQAAKISAAAPRLRELQIALLD